MLSTVNVRPRRTKAIMPVANTASTGTVVSSSTVRYHCLKSGRTEKTDSRVPVTDMSHSTTSARRMLRPPGLADTVTSTVTSSSTSISIWICHLPTISGAASRYAQISSVSDRNRHSAKVDSMPRFMGAPAHAVSLGGDGESQGASSFMPHARDRMPCGVSRGGGSA